MSLIESLINKQDTFEIIRDTIAQILADESANQEALATAAGEDPDEWKLRVFIERSNPWEQWLTPSTPTDKSPVVNVWYDSSTFDKASSNTIERQTTDGRFNIDCYGYGVSASDGTGHTPGDEAAALKAQQAVRLVRNILMSGQYTYLGLRGTVWQRWVQSITVSQPQQGSTPAVQVVGARLQLTVRFSEFSPQVEPQILEAVAIDITRADDGRVLAQVEYPD